MRIFYFANALLEKIFTREFYVENQAFVLCFASPKVRQASLLSLLGLAESPLGLAVKLVCLAENPLGLAESPSGLVVMLVCIAET